MAPANRKNPQNAKWSDSLYTLMDFMRNFPDDESCRHYLWGTRHAVGLDGRAGDLAAVRGSPHFQAVRDEAAAPVVACTACGLNIHPTAGTIFHKSFTSLHFWFYANVPDDQHSLWNLREAARTGDRRHLRDGVVHVPPDPQRMVERGGRVRADVVPDTKGTTLGIHVETRARRRASSPMKHPSMWESPATTTPSACASTHQQGIYVGGDVHTNTIEGFWSLVKRGIGGTHTSCLPSSRTT